MIESLTLPQVGWITNLRTADIFFDLDPGLAVGESGD